MSISPVGFTPIAPIAPPVATGATAAVPSGDSFATALGNGLEALAGTQAKAEGLAVQAATGQLTDVHQYTIAATQAQLATELTVAVRNKAVEAFNEILRMPL
ncbi:flagellar hook-basal body complex protein FliE [Sporichthya brevicatena]|uniref:Flagellar hook-basal body complex protein FliE n=1 Tax=Sporichthya brevicatena TaxID=171442 RepID=A0ABN1GE49_9ACTN